MTDDNDWVADVRRWYFSSRQQPSVPAPGAANYGDPVGYEAAQPALQARHWPDAPSTSPAEFR